MFETTCQTNMQFFNAIILLILRLMCQVILAERNHFCEAMVIQECSDNAQGLLKAIESRNQRLLIKECDALQVSHTIYISLKKLCTQLTIRKFYAAKVSETNISTIR